MTGPTDTDGMDEDLALAGELALRILPSDDEARARAREAADPAFAAQVEAWNVRLGGLAEAIAPVEPSTLVWPRIEAALAPPSADNDNSIVFWRRWAIGSTGLLAASVAAVVVLLAQPEPAPIATPASPPAIIKVATLTLESGAAAMTLAYDAGTGELYLAPTTEMAGDTRVPHLWLVLPEGGVQLVGAIDGSTTSRHSLGETLSGPARAANAVAVSMEAPGHTPAPNKPDGPVVAQGTMQRL